MSALEELFYRVPSDHPSIIWTSGWGQTDSGSNTFAYTRAGRLHSIGGHIKFTNSNTAMSSSNTVLAQFAGHPGIILPLTTTPTWALGINSKTPIRWMFGTDGKLYASAGVAWTATTSDSWSFHITWIA